MNIENKFEKGYNSRSYQRIDSEYKTNIFLGYNENGFMSMVITEKGQVEYIKPSKNINVQLKQREDGKLALSFDLLDNSYESMFIVFCKDIINSCESSGNNNAISNAIKRWNAWNALFRKKNPNILNKNEIQGLIGELIELKQNILLKYDEGDAINSWRGPLLGHKDFEISDTWYEVKSAHENSIEIVINSLEQLESDVTGYLVVVKLDETSSVYTGSINLNSIVQDVLSNLKDLNSIDTFYKKLESVGYSYNVEYNDYNYIYKSTDRYTVDSNFPRLTREQVNLSINRVKYTILLNSIVDFLEE